MFGEDIHKVSKTEAQAWFAFRQLLFNTKVMQNYEWTDFRAREISKALGLMNDVLLDQLIPLVELKQYLATLSIRKQPDAQNKKGATLLLEEIPELQNEYLKEIDVFGSEKLIRMQKQMFFDKSLTGPMAKRLNEAYNIEKILDLQGDDEHRPTNVSNTCGQCSQPAEKKCSRCTTVFYCSRECQVKHWAVHKSSCK